MKSQEKPFSPRGAEGQIKATLLKRLERLLRLRRDYREDLNPVGLRLMDRAIYATYQDCIEYGAADRARLLMVGQPLPGREGQAAGQ
jgi:hypothetical protein